MPDDRQQRILNQRDRALKKIQELKARPNDPGLMAELEDALKNLNNDYSHDLFKKLPTNPDEWKKLTNLLEGEELFRGQVSGREEIQKEFEKSQEVAPSTIDSHNLTDILSKQRETIKSLNEINQLRLTVKNSVENTLRSNLQGVLATDQIETLINHRGTKAELDKIVNSLTLKPHQNIDSLTHAIAENLLHSSDQRLHLLVQLSLNHDDNIQETITDAINGDKEVVKAFKHIEEKKVDGQATNEISELLKDSVITDKNQQPVLKPQLESILAKNNLNLSPLELAQVETLLESHLLTHTSVTAAEANTLINSTLVQFGSFRQLAPEVQLQVASEASEAFQTTFESMGKNEDITAFRTVAATNGVDSNILIHNITTEGFTTSEVIADAYDSNTSHGSSYNLNPHQLRLVADAIRDPSLLQKPEFAREFFSGTIESPNAMAQRWINVLQPSSSPQSGLFSSIKSWGQTTFSQAQVGFRGFAQNARAFFEPIGKGIGKLGKGTLGTTLKNIGSSIGTFLKTTLPQLGKVLVTAAKALGSILVKAGAALLASAEIWVPILIICIFIFFLVGPLIFPGAFSIAQTNLTPLPAGIASSPEDPNYIALICKTDDPECPTSFCDDCEWPVKCGPVSQCPGDSYSHKNANAIDFGMNTCAPALMGVYSQIKGTVDKIAMKYEDGTGSPGSSAGYGNYIDLRFTDSKTGREFILRYGHLSNQSSNGFTPKLAVGQSVVPGQILGYADHTGNSTAAHLHYELRAVDGGKTPSISTLVKGACD